MDCASMEPAPPWPDLPADALREIAGHLRDAPDFVRFHAVCRPWREAAPPRLPSFLPWLITPSGFATSAKMHFRSPFSGKSTSLDNLPPNRWRRLLGSHAANGRVLASCIAGSTESQSLVNPLTGDAAAVRRVPSIPPPCQSFRSPNGIFEYSTTYLAVYDYFWGWDLCYGDIPDPAATEGAATDDLLARQPGRDRHVFEFRRELLCVDVVDVQPWLRRAWDKLELVSVRALRVGDDGRLRWVTRDTAHLCLFLGWESSFAVDFGDFAGSTGMTGGCAYFIGRRNAGKKGFAVFRYSFQDGTAKVVDELPVRFGKKSMWFMPRPRQVSAVRAQSA